MTRSQAVLCRGRDASLHWTRSQMSTRTRERGTMSLYVSLVTRQRFVRKRQRVVFMFCPQRTDVYRTESTHSRKSSACCAVSSQAAQPLLRAACNPVHVHKNADNEEWCDGLEMRLFTSYMLALRGLDLDYLYLQTLTRHCVCDVFNDEQSLRWQQCDTEKETTGMSGVVWCERRLHEQRLTNDNGTELCVTPLRERDDCSFDNCNDSVIHFTHLLECFGCCCGCCSLFYITKHFSASPTHCQTVTSLCDYHTSDEQKVSSNFCTNGISSMLISAESCSKNNSAQTSHEPTEHGFSCDTCVFNTHCSALATGCSRACVLEAGTSHINEDACHCSFNTGCCVNQTYSVFTSRGRKYFVVFHSIISFLYISNVMFGLLRMIYNKLQLYLLLLLVLTLSNQISIPCSVVYL